MKALRPQEFRQQIIPHLNNLVYSDENSASFSFMIESSVNEAISSISKHSNTNGEFDKVLDILQNVGGRKLYEIIKDELIYDKSDSWNVVCHGESTIENVIIAFVTRFVTISSGDLWVNNLMFLKDGNEVKNTVFIDLQVFRYGNLVTDLLNFIYTTTSRQLREDNLDTLLSIYQKSLMDCLRRTLSKRTEIIEQMEKEFTLQNIRLKFASHALFGLASTLMVMPAITYDSLTPLIESILDDKIHEKVMTNSQPIEYHKRVRDLFEDFRNNGYIQSLSY